MTFIARMLQSWRWRQAGLCPNCGGNLSVINCGFAGHEHECPACLWRSY